jgi:hypothetical protein
LAVVLRGPTRALATVVAAAAIAAAGCGGGGDAEAVNAYIGQANDAQRTLATQVGRFNQALQSFADGGKLPRLAPRLAEIEAALAATHADLQRLQPPEDARKLHTLLLRYVRGQRELAREVTLFAHYQPALQETFEPLIAAEARLRRGLAGATAAGDQARAFAAFERAIARSRAALAQLEPPPVLRAAHEAQEARLQSLRQVTGELAAKLQGDDRAALERLLRRYGDLIAQVDTAAQRRERADAVRAYNTRIRKLDRVAADVRRELARLQQSL